MQPHLLNRLTPQLGQRHPAWRRRPQQQRSACMQRWYMTSSNRLVPMPRGRVGGVDEAFVAKFGRHFALADLDNKGKGVAPAEQCGRLQHVDQATAHMLCSSCKRIRQIAYQMVQPCRSATTVALKFWW